MPDGVWMILYRLAREGEDRYLRWFHEVHVPEKLARPGYAWAAHYRVAASTGGAEEDGAGGDEEGTGAGGARGARAYVALFGGESTRVFYDPSPAQLKLRQDETTREMMGLRLDSRAVVLAEEWREGGSEAVGAAAIALACFDAPGHEEALCAWCAQTHFPDLAARPGFAGVRKLLGSSGSPRHVVLAEYAALEAAESAGAAGREPGEGLESVTRPAGRDRVAERIWPPL